MKVAWVVLIVSAITDAMIAAGSGIVSAMMATGSAQGPSKGVLMVCTITGLMAGARTIQQALKATPETAAALKGAESVVTTSTVEKTP